MKLKLSKPIHSAYVPDEFVIFYTQAFPLLYFGEVSKESNRITIAYTIRRIEAKRFSLVEARDIINFLDRHRMPYKYEVFEPIFKPDFKLNGTPS